MKAVFDPRQLAHDPQFFLSSGAPQPCPEKPARADALLAATRRMGLETVMPADHGEEPIRAIHPERYLTFLRGIFPRWQRIGGASAEVIPNIHPDRRDVGYPASAVGQAGYHMTDTSCPIGAATLDAAYASAQTALHAAGLVRGGARAAYALCRPPGHHAFAESAGGFCYLNNSAIAAEYLTAQGARVAILDVDLHHGNGTQGIFYARGDVLTVSIHADPVRYYPFFWGYSDETGDGAGKGANLNLPCSAGQAMTAFLRRSTRHLTGWQLSRPRHWYWRLASMPSKAIPSRALPSQPPVSPGSVRPSPGLACPRSSCRRAAISARNSATTSKPFCASSADAGP